MTICTVPLQIKKALTCQIVSSCSTQFYEKACFPDAIQAIQKQIQQNGGEGDNMSAIGLGRFNVYSDGMKAPLKTQVPLAFPITRLPSRAGTYVLGEWGLICDSLFNQLHKLAYGVFFVLSWQ